MAEQNIDVRLVFLPGDYFPSNGLVLVVALSFDRAAGLWAVRCGIPCTPLMLFHQRGQMAVCGIWTLCQVHFKHRDCWKRFTDTETILLPVASLVDLDFKPSNVKINQCESVKVEERYARTVADHLMEAVPRNPYVHGLTPQHTTHRSNEEVPAEQDDSMALMQRPVNAGPLRVRMGQFARQWSGRDTNLNTISSEFQRYDIEVRRRPLVRRMDLEKTLRLHMAHKLRIVRISNLCRERNSLEALTLI